MNTKLIAIVAIATGLLAGCSGMGRNEATGTAIGGVGGAVLGSSMTGGSAVGAGLGAVAGGALGNVVGSGMDRR